MTIGISIRRRLERLELNFAIGRPIALWPIMMSFDEWERVALLSQSELIHESSEDGSFTVSTIMEGSLI